VKYLVDANVLSEPTRRDPNVTVVAWLRANEADLVVDPIVMGELSIGIGSLPSGRKRKQLEAWFETLSDSIECLTWDAMVSRRWADLVVRLRKRGEPMPLLDGMIAATALAYGLSVVTRNVADFARAGVPVVDPFRLYK
jgi:predicted nucleic acid-binding protein